MKLSKPRKVLDLDDFLPADGEERFETSYSQGDLNLDIYYESDDSEEELRKIIRFTKARHFFKSPFPGVSFFNCVDDKAISLLNSIVEYEQSELLDKDLAAPGAAGYKHYRLFLHSSGVVIYVVAQSLEVLN